MGIFLTLNTLCDENMKTCTIPQKFALCANDGSRIGTSEQDLFLDPSLLIIRFFS